MEEDEEDDDDDDDDDDDEEEVDEMEIDEDDDDDDDDESPTKNEVIDLRAIKSRRTRGIRVDYTSKEALEKAGLGSEGANAGANSTR